MYIICHYLEGKFFAQRIFLHFLIVFCEGYYPKSAIKFWKIMEFWYKIHSSLTCSITSSRSSVTDVTSATSVCCLASFFLIRLAAVESSYLCSITSSQSLMTIASFLTSFMLNCFVVDLSHQDKSVNRLSNIFCLKKIKFAEEDVILCLKKMSSSAIRIFFFKQYFQTYLLQRRPHLAGPFVVALGPALEALEQGGQLVQVVPVLQYEGAGVDICPATPPCSMTRLPTR